MFNASDGTSLVNAAKSASTDFPEITMLILKVHTEKASDKDKLYTMAPNPDNAAVSQYGMITLNDIKGHLSSLADISEQGRYVMLSVGMFARAYRITTGQLGIAESSVVFDYPSACHCPPGICELRTGDPYDSMDVTVEVWDQKMLVFFDSAKQMVTRAKSRLDALPKNYSGIAAYNVEMDDFDGSCDGAKKFERLGVIREQIANAKEP
ncbi:uncharacterized protein LOC125946714 [Dermacentor silvarum]|uniref:uncharacterized protein LOC125946714 n=1 Tax=Dermacentor silvarum TaxID=543639 RepID=UPI002100AFB4|nr:uncharacterized protein LOC125946714 [Dermacentor silvarum]